MASKKPPKPGRMEQNRTPARERPTSEVLKSARESMLRTQLALRDLTGNDYERKAHGLRDVIVYGRTVTFPMQVLGGGLLVNGQTQWYRDNVLPRMAEPVPVLFKTLRNAVEKEGILETVEANTGIHIRRLSGDDPTIRNNMPYGTRSWTVANDGSIRYLCSQGHEISRLTTHPEILAIAERYFADAPEDLRHQRVEDLARDYVDLLQAIVDVAQAEFGHLP